MEGGSSPRGGWRPRPHKGGGGPPPTRRGGGGPPRAVGELLDIECTFISTCDSSDRLENVELLVYSEDCDQ